jgi:type III pantothenate kinase
MAMNQERHWVLDIGNTCTKLAVFQEGQLKDTWMDQEAETEANKAMIAGDLPAKMLIAASGETPLFWDAWKTRWNASHPIPDTLVFLDSNMDLGFEIRYESLETIGLDRLANAAAAIALKTNVPWLIIDLGTCMTVDAVENSAFIGGSIAPGIDLRLRSMYAGTHALPYPDNWRELVSSGIAMHIGNNTISCLLAGALGGITAEIHGRIREFKKHWPDLHIAVTGGDVSFLDVEDSSPIFVDPNLTVTGYYHILQTAELR